MSPRRSLLPLLAGLAFAMTLGCGSPLRADEPPVVAAASDLQFALEEIAAAFTSETGQEVKLSFGSTGNFARQIREGAPFQVFMAADEKFVLDLAKDGFTRDEGEIYAEGRIVLAVPEGSILTADGSLESLRRLMDEGKLTRFAIANPEHAPYGKRAEEALKHAGIWDSIQPNLVLGENVSQAAQFALSGNAEGGIIAYSLVLAPDMAGRAKFALIPADWHKPLLQRMVVLKDAGPTATAFYDFMRGADARAIMEKYGFVLPKG